MRERVDIRVNHAGIAQDIMPEEDLDAVTCVT